MKQERNCSARKTERWRTFPNSTGPMLQHTKRAVYQAGIWTTCHQPNNRHQLLKAAVDTGCRNKVLGSCLELAACGSIGCSELVKCACKSAAGCGGRCSCKKASWKCTELCSCKYTSITFEELSSSYKEKTIIDVRNRNEIEACGQIPGAHCIPVTEIKLACDLDKESFKSRYGFEKPDCEDALVVCCKTGVRSKAACDLLQCKGYKRHRLYSGSFSEWEEKGGEVLRPGQPHECMLDDSSDEEEQPSRHIYNNSSPSQHTPL
ncbi:Thiosulfate sulfurtransferase/rhodanese-like domain-containing protein 3 [Chionoecetes opilio]|uniref:Thiosulfate sulfurtransferase/rhodanese-like domain-containing protein 3 n=1 Tax=Chionoecetes opilio TaxID=41210 RepID=A0A8J4Y8H6_CHIOP|nr:Thiosulfate sulfurtransferase/rhodanese-like domain-containing protein 3 [Chionoecetes opilio]